MYSDQPVPVPKRPGKITIRKKQGSEYVQYETGRVYNPARRYNVPERKVIGIVIPSLPGMMLPNENYDQYFREEEHMNEEQQQTAKTYTQNRARFIMLREMFDQMYYEFQIQSRRKPDEKVNAYKSRKINSILIPLREMMAGEEYAQYLDLIDETPDAEEPSGQTFSDAALMLTQYRGAIKRFFSERM